MTQRLVLATHNPGKLTEWRALLGPLQSVADLGLPVPDETGDTFVSNAIIKATAASVATGHACLAEDAGLVLADGAPGVHTARYMRDAGGWNAGMSQLLTRDNRAAVYVCALALALPGGVVHTAEARAPGRVGKPRGNGPGVCPWFYPDALDQTWAELGPHWRRAHDHRALALALLWPHLTPVIGDLAFPLR